MLGISWISLLHLLKLLQLNQNVDRLVSYDTIQNVRNIGLHLRVLVQERNQMALEGFG